MAFFVIELDLPNDTIAQLNDKLCDSSKPHEGVVEVRTLMDALLAGAKDGSASCYVRSTTASVAASGGGSSSSYNLK